MDDALVAALARTPAWLPHLHVPLQSGSDDVLRRMRRRYGRERYLARVQRAREALGDVQVTADVIVGYPGETDDDFAATLDVVRARRAGARARVPVLAAPGHRDRGRGRRAAGRQAPPLGGRARAGRAPGRGAAGGAARAARPGAGGAARRERRAAGLRPRLHALARGGRGGAGGDRRCRGRGGERRRPGGEDRVIARVQADLREARLARDAARVQVLGTLLAALQGAEKDAGGALDDAAATAVLRRERKRRAEAAESFREAGREEDAAREDAEGVLIEGYMPAALDPAELDRMVAEAVAEAGATTPREMGAVMKLLTPRVAGRADGRTVSDAVKRALAG